MSFPRAAARSPAIRVRPAVAAVSVGFGLKGVAFAAMISRTPDIRDALALSLAGFGLLLLCFSGGAICGLPIAGAIVHRLGSARSALFGGVVAAIGLASLAGGLANGWILPAAAGLAALGLGNGVWDVAVNVDGVDLERRIDGSLLPQLHAVFSVGTVVGAALGTAGAHLSIPLSIQLVVISVVVVGVLAVATRFFVDDRRVAEPAADGAVGKRSGLLAAWCEPRTVLIGLAVLGFAFAEGSANDWIAILYVDAFGVDTTVAAVAYATFVAAVTLARFTAAVVLRRFGRTAVLSASAVVALFGLATTLATTSVIVAFVGTVLWGLGTALGFPVGISMAGSGDRAQAAARVTVVSSLGYTAFLGGPPLLGMLAGVAGVGTALWIVTAGLVVAFCSVVTRHRIVRRESAADHDMQR